MKVKMNNIDRNKQNFNDQFQIQISHFKLNNLRSRFNQQNKINKPHPLNNKTYHCKTEQHQNYITAWQTNQDILKQIDYTNVLKQPQYQRYWHYTKSKSKDNNNSKLYVFDHHTKIKMLKKQREYLQSQQKQTFPQETQININHNHFNNKNQNLDQLQNRKKYQKFPTDQDLLVSQRTQQKNLEPQTNKFMTIQKNKYKNKDKLNHRIRSGTILYRKRLKTAQNNHKQKSQKIVNLGVISRPLTSKCTNDFLSSNSQIYDDYTSNNLQNNSLNFEPIHKGNNIPYAFRHSSVTRKRKQNKQIAGYYKKNSQGVGILFIKKYHQMVKGRKLNCCGNTNYNQEMCKHSNFQQALKNKYQQVFQ